MFNSTSFFAGQVVLVGYSTLWTFLSPFQDPPSRLPLTSCPFSFRARMPLSQMTFAVDLALLCPHCSKVEPFTTIKPPLLPLFSCFYFPVPHPFHRNNQSQKHNFEPLALECACPFLFSIPLPYPSPPFIPQARSAPTPPKRNSNTARNVPSNYHYCHRPHLGCLIHHLLDCRCRQGCCCRCCCHPCLSHRLSDY